MGRMEGLCPDSINETLAQTLAILCLELSPIRITQFPVFPRWAESCLRGGSDLCLLLGWRHDSSCHTCYFWDTLAQKHLITDISLCVTVLKPRRTHSSKAPICWASGIWLLDGGNTHIVSNTEAISSYLQALSYCEDDTYMTRVPVMKTVTGQGGGGDVQELLSSI